MQNLNGQKDIGLLMCIYPYTLRVNVSAPEIAFHFRSEERSQMFIVWKCWMSVVFGEIYYDWF